MSQTNEHAFESYVEEMLQARGSWQGGRVAQWDKEPALFPAQVFAFIADTQLAAGREFGPSTAT